MLTIRGINDHYLTVLDLADPGLPVTDTLFIIGLNPETQLVGMDVRNATGLPYVIGSDGPLYVLGAPKAATPTTVPAEKVGTPISLAAFPATGFDFNPAVDRLRIISGVGNLRVNPNNGTAVDGDTMLDGTQPDGNLAYAEGDPGAGTTPDANAAAYTNPVQGGVATTTVLYDLEGARDVLVTQNPPNSGTLNSVGPVGVNVDPRADIDVASNGVAFAVITPETDTLLYTVNLATGTATPIGAAPALFVAAFPVA